MISLVLKPANTRYPSSASIAAEIDMLLANAAAQGREAEMIVLPYGYIHVLQEAGLTQSRDSFIVYQGIILRVA